MESASESKTEPQVVSDSTGDDIASAVMNGDSKETGRRLFGVFVIQFSLVFSDAEAAPDAILPMVDVPPPVAAEAVLVAPPVIVDVSVPAGTPPAETAAVNPPTVASTQVVKPEPLWKFMHPVFGKRRREELPATLHGACFS